MIKWAQPVYLWFLPAVPVAAAAVVVLVAYKRRQLRARVDADLVPALVSAHARGLELLQLLLLVGALAALLVAAARPKWGEQLQMYKGRGIDVVIALDGSKSMLAEDVKPNRLERAKTELAGLIDGLTGNAVGIVAFAGDAYVMCPLTADLDAARQFLDIIEPDMMPVPGTDFGRAIDVATGLFNPKEKKHKALILVTDGDDLGRNTQQAVQRAVENGVRVFPVAIATTEGAPIPEYDARGTLKEYKKDKDGNIVMSRLNERQLILLARLTQGRFLRVEGFSAERLIGELNRMRKKEIGGGAFTDYVERYQLFLIIALVLFLASMFISDRRRRWFPGSLFVLLLVSGLFSTARADVGGLMRKGNGLYARGKYDEALAAYQRAEVLEPDATAIHFNLGNALYRMGQYQEAASELELVMTEPDLRRRADAMYNIGNTVFKAGRLDGALQAYRSALVMNPDDRQAKENLEFCLKKKEEMEQQPDSTGQQQQQQQQDEQQRPDRMGRDQAERVLQALEGKEKEEQKRAHQPDRKRKVDKDW